MVHDWQAEGRSFTGARLCQAHHVAASQGMRNGLDLDWGWINDALCGQLFHEARH